MATINGTSVGGMTLQIDYSYTQNTTANTTSVTAKLQLVGHYALYATALSGSYISVGGSRTDYSKSISYGGSGTTTTVLATKTVIVSHNNDGTGSCNLSGTFVMNGSYRDYSVGTMSVSSTITLPTIPRSSGLTVPASVNTGTTLSGSVAPSNSAFNHKVEFKIGSTVKSTLILAANQTSPTFTQAIGHDWFPNSTSGTINVVLSTYSGTTLIATASKNITANVPTSVVPSVSAFTAVIAANGLSGLYVQGKTTAKLTATATAGSGSSIKSYEYSGPNVYASTTSNNTTTDVIQTSGTLTYTVKVTDLRGRTASKTVQIYVYPYSVPSIGPVDVKRCDANGNLTEGGTYAKYTVNSTYATVNSKNTRTITVAYSSNNGASYSEETTIQAATDTASTKTGVYGGGVFALASTYILRFTIKDAYGVTDTFMAPLQSAARPINIRSNGKGVAIGGMSTKDAFECSFDADFNKNVNIDGTTTATGSISTKANLYSNALELGSGATPTNNGGYIDFHYNGSASDYTVRIIESSSGTIQVQPSTATVSLPKVSATSLTIGSNSVNDFVVEQGVSSGWNYVKWNSGKSEAWRSIELGDVPLTTQMIAGVYSNTSYNGRGVTFPTGLFTAIPLAFANVYSNGYTHCQVASANTTQLVYRLWSPYSATVTGTIVSLHVIGRWK